MMSKIEEQARKVLQPLGFIPYEAYLPGEFVDKEGQQFEAKSDFYHPATGIYLEVKDSSLNSKTSKATAESAMARVDPDRYWRAKTYYQIQNGWNHAAAKQSAVQHVLTPENFMIVFVNKPDAKTMKLIEKYDIHACDLRHVSRYLSIMALSQAIH